MKTQITSIIRVSGDYKDFEDNLIIRSYMFDKFYKNYVDYILIDYSDDDASSESFRSFAEKAQWKYIKYLPKKKMCTSEAINVGIKNAATPYILLEDIDLIHAHDFYKRLHEEIISTWNSRPFNFYSVPVAYLSEIESEKLKNNPCLLSGTYLNQVADSLEFQNNPELFQHFAPQSSLILLKRSSAYFVGLFDEQFVGWGGEDRDFIFRLLSVNTHILHNKDFHYTSTESGDRISKYIGWKAIWTLHGDYLYNKRILSFHLYHGQREWKNGEKKGNARDTIQFAIKKAKIIGSDYFKTLTPSVIKEEIFVFGRNPHVFNEQLFDALGGFRLIEESAEISDIKDIVGKNSKIIFWNPWGSSRRLFIYNKLKEEGYDVYVAERGALPNSIVFDRDGLVIFSQSYARNCWDKELTQSEKEYTNNYINNLKESSSTLEAQGSEIDENIVRLKLNQQAFKKTILVCLQLSIDTVTNQKVDGFCTYREYLETLKEFVEKAPIGWKVLIKNHPLTKEKVSIPGATIVDDVHIHTLMKISDFVVVYNSGTGIIARIFEKPVITFGPNSYNDPYFTRSCHDSDELIKLINDPFTVNPEKVTRYISYLLHKMYSFANFYDITTRITDKANLKYPKKISYYIINNPFNNKRSEYYRYVWSPDESLLFRRFFSSYSVDQKTQKKSMKSEVLKSPLRKTSELQSKKIRLINKFKNNPYAYFNDSKYPIRWMRFFFKKL